MRGRPDGGRPPPARGRSRPAYAPALRSPTLGLAAHLSFLVPALMLAFPILLWPLTEGANLAPESDFAVAPPTSEPGILNRIWFPSLFLWGLLSFIALPRERLRDLAHPAVLSIALLLLWAAATVLWSQAPHLVVRRSLQQLIIVLAYLLPVLAARRPEPILHALLAVCAVTVAANILPVLTEPPGPIGHEGIYPQKNYFGAVMVLCILVALVHVVADRGLVRLGSVLLILVAFAMLIVSRSKTSLALAVMAPAIGFGLYIASRYLRTTPMVLMPLFMVVCYGIYVLGARAYLWDFPGFATAVFGDPTLTRRTDIWAFAVSMIELKPILGWGYESFWNYSYEAPSVRHGTGFVASMPHAHNGYLDALIHTGAVGFAILLVVILTTLSGAHRLSQREPRAALLVIFAIVLAIGYNFLETAWFSGFNMISGFFILSAALVARFGQSSRPNDRTHAS
jgi:O-antigen ligase